MRSGSLNDIDSKVIEDGPLVSIIIPVYNTPEGPLRRCLRSLLELDYGNIELIVVDDGSDENCVAVLNEVLSSESHAHIIAGGHRGVSHARNVGMDAAKGEWVAFSDADDEVEPRFVSDALKVALTEGVDFVCGSVDWLFRDSVPDRSAYGLEYFVADTAHELIAARMQMFGPAKYVEFTGPDFRGRGPIAKLYKNSFLTNLRFDEGIPIGEDALFNYQYLKRCQTMVIVDSLWYFYYQYERSAIHNADLTPCKKSIKGILANREDNEPFAAFDSRASYLCVQEIESLLRLVGIFDAGARGAELLAFAANCGCFSNYCFDGYEPSPWLRHFLSLCKAGCFRRASWFWVFKTLLKDRLAGAKLIDPDSVLVV